MRVVKDIVGDVSNHLGQQLYTNTRMLVDDQGRVAVFTSRAAPTVVYGKDDVTYTISRRPCSCKGDVPKASLQRLWETAERVRV